MKICPSLISSDLLNLQQTVTLFDSVCDGYHLDVMDDHFVPNLTWGADFVNAIRAATSLPLLIHLMVEKPDIWVERLLIGDSDYFVFHYEVVQDKKDCINLIEKVLAKGWKVGIAVSPKTSIEHIFDIVSYLDIILLLSVEPGFSGQVFIPSVVKKIVPLVEIIDRLDKKIEICMDGGVGEENIKMLAQEGVSCVAIGSSIFGAQDPVSALRRLYKKVS